MSYQECIAESIVCRIEETCIAEHGWCSPLLHTFQDFTCKSGLTHCSAVQYTMSQAHTRSRDIHPVRLQPKHNLTDCSFTLHAFDETSNEACMYFSCVLVRRTFSTFQSTTWDRCYRPQVHASGGDGVVTHVCV